MALPASAWAQGATYEALVREAVAEYNVGNWGEARLLFGKAHEIEPNARTFRGMGLCDYEAKRYVEAIGALEAALASSVKRLTEAQREEVEGVLERSKRFIAIYTLVLPSDASELRLDDKPVEAADGTLHVNPGEHVLSVRRGSGARLERRFVAEVGARGALELSEQPVDEPRARAVEPTSAPDRQAGEEGRVWTWVAGGATVAFSGASLAFGLLALDAHDELQARAAAGERADDVKEDGQRYQLLANVGLGLAAAAAITTVVLFVIEGADDERAQARGLELQVGLGAIGVRGAL